MGKKKHSQPSPGAAGPIDAIAIAEDFGVEERAHKAAKSNLPQRPTAGPDSNEHAIQAHHGRLKAQTDEESAAQLAAIDQEQRQLGAQFAQARIEQIVDETEDRVQIAYAKHQRALTEAQRRARETGRDYDHYRHKHDIRREPDIPESVSWHYAVVFFLFLVEGGG